MRYLFCLLLLGCACHKDVVVAPVKRLVIVAAVPTRHLVAGNPQKRLSPLHVNKTPKRIHIAPKRIEILPIPSSVLFQIGRARSIPKLWISEVVALCQKHKIALIGSASPDGSKARNRELSCLRASNAYKAVLRAGGCPEGNLYQKAVTGGNRSVSIEVLK